MKRRNVAITFAFAIALSSISLSQESAQAGPAEFDHQAIHVRDLAKSAAFYETVLELKRMQDPFHDHRHIWFQTGAHSQLHVIGSATAITKQDIDVHMSFRVKSVDEFVPKLQRYQLKYVNSKGEVGKITLRPDGVKQVYFQDPDGYWIEVNDDRF